MRRRGCALPQFADVVEQQLCGDSVDGESKRKLSGDDHWKHACSNHIAHLQIGQTVTCTEHPTMA